MKQKEPLSTEYSEEEMKEMIELMKETSRLFYSLATANHVHAFIEFTGLMNEYIKVCEEALQNGIQFPFANIHSGTELPFHTYNVEYLAEKLNCIYGPGLLSSEKNRKAFITTLFEGQYKLVKVEQNEEDREEDLAVPPT